VKWIQLVQEGVQQRIFWKRDKTFVLRKQMEISRPGEQLYRFMEILYDRGNYEVTIRRTHDMHGTAGYCFSSESRN
jgi:hypothetical protein